MGAIYFEIFFRDLIPKNIIEAFFAKKYLLEIYSPTDIIKFLKLFYFID